MSSVDDSKRSAWRAMQDESSRRRTPSIPPALNTPGGGGTFGGMDPWQTSVEARLSELRSDLRNVASDVSALKSSTAVLAERMSHLPTKTWMITTAGGLLTLGSAVAVFLQHIRAFLGL